MAAPAGSIRQYQAARHASTVDHAVVYRREDEFSSWPYTSGFWENGEGTLIANFATRNVEYQADAIDHDSIEAGSGSNPRQITVRSHDRGRTWDGDDPQENMFSGLVERGTETADSLAPFAPIDYLDPNTLIANGSVGGFSVRESRGTVRVSKDGGRTWTPPVVLPLDGLVSTTGIHSSLVRPDGKALLFMWEVDQDNHNRHPLVYRSTADGTNFHFLSYITPKRDPKMSADGNIEGSIRFIGHRWFYPRGHLLKSGRMLCTLRCQRDPRGIMWTEIYYSDDGGETWGFLSRVNDWGAPGDLVVMPDGRLVVVYGYRVMPAGIRAVVSEDEGRTWGSEIIVRDDGGSWDLGYPNAWVAGDGEVGTIYYFNSKDDPVQQNGGKRHIARSIFTID